MLPGCLLSALSAYRPCASLQLEEKVQDALAKGAVAACGGQRPRFEDGSQLRGGFFYEPTVLTGSRPWGIGPQGLAPLLHRATLQALRPSSWCRCFPRGVSMAAARLACSAHASPALEPSFLGLCWLWLLPRGSRPKSFNLRMPARPLRILPPNPNPNPNPPSPTTWRHPTHPPHPTTRACRRQRGHAHVPRRAVRARHPRVQVLQRRR